MSRRLLHWVSQSPFSHNALAQCLRYWQPGDGIVFIEDGVYGLLKSHALTTQLANKPCYAVIADIQARGLDASPELINHKKIDLDDLVALCTEYDLVQNWY